MYRLGNIDQSVSKKNMLKNIEMQKRVSYQLVKLYDAFYKKNNMYVNQDNTIFNTFKRSIGSSMRTYLLLDTYTAKKNIIDFDQNIRSISEVSFSRLNDDRFIYCIRFKNYIIIPLFRMLYRIWVLKYK